MSEFSFDSYKEYKNKYSHLVQLEREEEMKRHRDEIKNMRPKERESEGRALLDMKGDDEGKGLGGRYIVKFSRNYELPDNELSVGDLVMVSKNEPLNPDNPTGTVIKKTNHSVSVAFDIRPNGFVYSSGLRLDLYVNDVTFQRMLDALNVFSGLEGKMKVIRNIILGLRKPRFKNEEPKFEEIKFNNKELNESQKEAVKKAIQSKDIFLVHGPPGTGKTTTLVEIIEQCIDRGKKVLATADSNVAIDNIVDLLSERGRNGVRIGHPARVTSTLRKHTLDYIIEDHKKYQRAQNCRDKAYEINEEQENYTYPSGRWRRGLSNDSIKDLASKGRGSRGVPPDKIKSMAKWIDMQETKEGLFEKAERLEDEAVDDVLRKSDVICTTNSTSGSEILENKEFDVVVTDEATQATEPSCLIPLIKGRKLVMAGDHKQLPPTMLNQEAKEKGLEITMFERLVNLHENKIKEMLSIQYRMNEEIMDFPSNKFYNGKLKADKQVKNHKLSDRLDRSNKSCKDTIQLDTPITYIDTNTKHREETPSNSNSKRNKGEANIVKNVFNYFLEEGIKAEDIGIISPYDAQVSLLRMKIDEGVEISTVDGFQGREKEVIIISFVRSNKSGEIGFLKELRRLNVSITRARRKLVLVGDSNTLKKNSFYGEYLRHLKDVAEYVQI